MQVNPTQVVDLYLGVTCISSVKSCWTTQFTISKSAKQHATQLVSHEIPDPITSLPTITTHINCRDTIEFSPFSSESDNNGLGDKQGQRSVFLHAACVADIPVQGPGGPGGEAGKRGPRAVSADASLSGGRNGGPPMQQQQQQRPEGPPQTQANLKNSKKLSRSISMLAPWKPKPVARQYQV